MKGGSRQLALVTGARQCQCWHPDSRLEQACPTAVASFWAEMRAGENSLFIGRLKAPKRTEAGGFDLRAEL